MKYSALSSIFVFALTSTVSPVSAATSTSTAPPTGPTSPPACVLACVAKVAREQGCNNLGDIHCVGSTHSAQVDACLDSICPSGQANNAKNQFHSSYTQYVQLAKTSSVY